MRKTIEKEGRVFSISENRVRALVAVITRDLRFAVTGFH